MVTLSILRYAGSIFVGSHGGRFMHACTYRGEYACQRVYVYMMLASDIVFGKKINRVESRQWTLLEPSMQVIINGGDRARQS